MLIPLIHKDGTISEQDLPGDEYIEVPQFIGPVLTKNTYHRYILTFKIEDDKAANLIVYVDQRFESQCPPKYRDEAIQGYCIKNVYLWSYAERISLSNLGAA